MQMIQRICMCVCVCFLKWQGRSINHAALQSADDDSLRSAWKEETCGELGGKRKRDYLSIACSLSGFFSPSLGFSRERNSEAETVICNAMHQPKSCIVW